MHDKFEKEVQQKMEELKLRPSEPVWEKIEMAITPERKRKRSILWLSLAVLLLGGGGVLTYQLSKDPEQEIGRVGIIVTFYLWIKIKIAVPFLISGIGCRSSKPTTIFQLLSTHKHF